MMDITSSTVDGTNTWPDLSRPSGIRASCYRSQPGRRPPQPVLLCLLQCDKVLRHHKGPAGRNNVGIVGCYSRSKSTAIPVYAFDFRPTQGSPASTDTQRPVAVGTDALQQLQSPATVLGSFTIPAQAHCCLSPSASCSKGQRAPAPDPTRVRFLASARLPAARHERCSHAALWFLSAAAERPPETRYNHWAGTA